MSFREKLVFFKKDGQIRVSICVFDVIKIRLLIKSDYKIVEE